VRTFRNDAATPSELLQGIVDEANLWVMSGFRALRWLSHLLGRKLLQCAEGILWSVLCVCLVNHKITV
jgi:hypothetical protein